MRGPRWTNSFRHSLPPLVVVLALLGPAPALAAGPAPDAPGAHAAAAGKSLGPDPSPAAVRTVKHAAVVITRPRSVAPRPAESLPAVRSVVEPATPARVVPKRPRVAAHVPVRTRPLAVRVADVMPLRVDLHPSLGAVAAPLFDHSTLLLAAVAMLVAVATAGSGAALVLTAREHL